MHGEHRSQISQAFIPGNAFANPAQLSDPLFALSALNLPGYLAHLPDRRALVLDPAAVYVLATDGFWACERPADWLARWPDLFDMRRGAFAMCSALFDEMASRPPPGLHSDNLSAIVLCTRTTDDTALPADIQT